MSGSVNVACRKGLRIRFVTVSSHWLILTVDKSLLVTVTLSSSGTVRNDGMWVDKVDIADKCSKHLNVYTDTTTPPGSKALREPWPPVLLA